MLYKNNGGTVLSRELFGNPTSEYRATPFWAWNCELKPELLLKEIDDMKDMGFGGFHMHARVGLATEYLGRDFFDSVRTCVEKARKEKMLAWLYDEDRWPSGFAGGMVTCEEKYRRRHLEIALVPFEGFPTHESELAHARRKPNSTVKLISAYDVELDQNGYLVSYKTVAPEEKAEHTKCYAYSVIDECTNRFNGYTYVDTMNREAIEKFIEVTHEAYKKEFSEDFGGVIPAIFTDEPQMSFFEPLRTPYSGVAKFHYTEDIADTYFSTYGETLIDKLPELAWELSDGRGARTRYRYFDHVSERFAAAFADTIGEWCEKNSLPLTGHMMNEASLFAQTLSVGDCMRSYRGFGIPGMDLLCDRREFTTAKQVQSSVHQYGREAMLSELYGVTNWDFDFKRHKLQGDWQAALGVTVRVPHLFWLSMGGEAKRDYPAAIGYQSPWYKQYKYVEDHFARVNTAITRGKPIARIGVIHPIESYWLHCGPLSQTAISAEDMDKRFHELTEWLIFGTLDYDFICEGNLPELYSASEKGFKVGRMTYDAIVVPACETLRKTTVEALSEFAAKGGKVIFMDAAPKLVAAESSDDVVKLANKCVNIPWSRNALYNALEAEREIEIRDNTGKYSNNLIYQYRDDGEHRYLFICHANLPREFDTAPAECYTIKLRGEWKLTELDTIAGKTRRLRVSYKNGCTELVYRCHCVSSLLLELEGGKDAEGEEIKLPSFKNAVTLPNSVTYKLEEPNVLVLDTPSYSFDGGEEKAASFILKVDDDIRKHMSIPSRGNGSMKQPWLEPLKGGEKHPVKLKYEFYSELECDDAQLALEALEFSNVTLNGKKADMTKLGYYVDMDSIARIALPKIIKGRNELVIDVAFSREVQLEACYILGNFGVQLHGTKKIIVEAQDELGFGDIRLQGMPFYGGNISYEAEIDADGVTYVEITRYRGNAVTVELDGEYVGLIALPPNRLCLGELHGKHKLTLTCLGNRINTFGTFHNADFYPPYCGPDAWRTKDSAFFDQYQLHESGIISSPRILTEK